MGKYYELIEFLKTEYLGHAYADVGEDVPQAVKNLESNFEIKITRFDDKKLTHIKHYNIKSKVDKKHWSFTLGPTSIFMHQAWKKIVRNS